MKKSGYQYLLILFAFIIFSSISCSTTRYVEPLPEGELDVGINAGGPLLVFGGSSIPLPLSSVYAGYGYSEKMTLYGGLHLTSLAFQNIQIDAGARKKLVEGYGIYPHVSGALVLNGIIGLRDGTTRIFPEVSLNPYWRYGRWKTYTGVQAWFDFYKFGGTNYGYGGFFVPALSLGQSIDLGKWELSLEYKRLGFTVPTENSVVNYIVPSGIGAHGFYFSVGKSFGYKNKKEVDEK